ncbi:hypothetical protein [Tunturiibacter lichenicola]|uniref:hypothetical protein n=1 Tax=Tunturiibacter lichenicola TaxID=2051959 RepID=UPI003D9BCCBC
MRLRSALIGPALLFLPGVLTYAQSVAIDLTPFGYKKVMSGSYANPAFASLSYVGDNTLFVTFPTDNTFITTGQPFDYTGLVIDKSGVQVGKTQLSGSYEDVLQRRLSVQPLSKVLVKVKDELRIYNLDLDSFRSIELPLRSQLRVAPDRKIVVAISQESNKSMDTIVTIQDATSNVDHLDFDERAVREGLLAVSNDGSVAHAVSGSDGELAVHSWSLKWPAFQIGKYQKPLAFTKSNELLVSAMAATPFPPTELYLWKQDGEVHKVRGSKAGFYSSAQPSLDGQRVLLTQTNINDFLVLKGGGDCGRVPHTSILMYGHRPKDDRIRSPALPQPPTK